MKLKRLIFATALLVLLAAAVVCFFILPVQPLSPCDADASLLRECLMLQKETKADWRFLYAAVSDKNAADAADALPNAPERATDGEELLETYRDAYGHDKTEKSVLAKLKIIDDIAANGGFPLSRTAGYTMEDTWGSARTYGGKRSHEGTDIMCREGTPIIAAASGTVTRKGWNELGGYRLGITDENGVYYYYAHLSRYAEVREGVKIERGQVIGYAGSTGYGPEGTSGKFAPHLHFGMYYRDKAFNPYPYLVYWEK